MLQLHRKGWQRLWVILAIVTSAIVPPFVINEAWEHPDLFLLAVLARPEEHKARFEEIIEEKKKEAAKQSLKYLAPKSSLCWWYHYAYAHTVLYSNCSATLSQLESSGYPKTKEGYEAYLLHQNIVNTTWLIAGWLMVLLVSYFGPWGLYLLIRWVVRGFKEGR